MLKLSETPVVPKTPQIYNGNREYRVETHGYTSTFYMHMTPEIIGMVQSLKLGSAEGGIIGLHVPNGDLPPAVIIHCDKADKFKEMLEAVGYKANDRLNLEGRMQQ